MTILVCDKCGWAHFGLTKESIEKSSDEFMEYYNGLSEEKRNSFYGTRVTTKESLIASQEHCFNCGGSYNNFHPEHPDDRIPDGCTIQGIRFPD